mgnify:CR=1 FL=1
MDFYLSRSLVEIMPLVVRRILAFIIDYFIILAYAGILFGVSFLIADPQPLHPIKAQILGFVTLTLPIFLYSFLLEKSSYRATLGKRLMKLSVQYSNSIDVAQRNFLKYLPWEIAHTGIHWLMFYSWSEQEIPLWVWVLTYLSQLLALVYFISLFRAKGTKTLYDFLAGTRLVYRNH